MDGYSHIQVKGKDTLKNLRDIESECIRNLKTCRPSDREYWQEIKSNVVREITVIERRQS